MDAGGSVAEGVGFEPTEACASAVFKTTAFVHSATPQPNLSVEPAQHTHGSNCTWSALRPLWAALTIAAQLAPDAPSA